MKRQSKEKLNSIKTIEVCLLHCRFKYQHVECGDTQAGNLPGAGSMCMKRGWAAPSVPQVELQFDFFQMLRKT